MLRPGQYIISEPHMPFQSQGNFIFKDLKYSLCCAVRNMEVRSMIGASMMHLKSFDGRGLCNCFPLIRGVTHAATEPLI